MLVNGRVVVEIKVAPEYDKCDEAQLLNELKATVVEIGLYLTSAERSRGNQLVFSIRMIRCLDSARHDRILSPEKKIAGILAPLFALRGENDLGIGDVGTLREFLEWARENGFRLVQMLPINETGQDNSPYNAISSRAIEPTTLHLAPGSPEELTQQDFITA